MLSFTKSVPTKYRTLVVKMNNDLHIMIATKTNLQQFYDVEVVMGLTCIMPLLEAIHALIKFVQAHDT
jgi:hypothetical protein